VWSKNKNKKMQEDWFKQVSGEYVLVNNQLVLTQCKINGDPFFLAVARWWTKEDKNPPKLLWFSRKIMESDKIIVDVNEKDVLGWTALAYAARYHKNDTGFVEFLLKHPDIDVNCQDIQGWTPLMNAVRNVKSGDSSLAIVKLLLAHPKIDLNVYNLQNESAWSISVKHPASTFPLLATSKLLNRETAKRLAKK